MINRNDANYDKDKVYCPISMEIMYHPVEVLPSGRHYELALLIESIRSQLGLKCPITKLPIQAVKYDLSLKTQLDAEYSNADDRYEEYSRIEAMLTLQSQITIKKNPVFSFGVGTDFGFSFSLFGISLGIIQLLCSYNDAEISDGLCYLFAASLGTIDYGLRKMTGSHFGVFTVFTNTAKSAYQIFRGDVSDEQREELLDLRV
ncbi:MAG: U-box domain-containing protein [Gammaproteobacteria bacterium]